MYRVLIADDEMIERTVLFRTLDKNLKGQCQIFQAENGRETLEIYEREQIQILILDIEMPGINGIEAAERIRQKDKECSIIFLTAFDEFSYAKKAITVRALDYLLKPYDEQELMLVMDEAMSQADAHAKRKQELWEREKKDGTSLLAADWSQGGEDLAQQPLSGQQADLGRQDQETWEESGNVRMDKVTEMIFRYIQENYKYDISMQELAKAMNYSEAYFCKLFKQCFSKNFTSYLTEYRVKEAKRMLEQPTVNVKDVGKAVGYMDSNYFARVFKRITGQTPTEYRMCIFQRK
ncbi:MAG: response regulator [Hungatella sp.]|jgi:two-component system response regulator YesN|nr:response regulator [Hungatella sp.]